MAYKINDITIIDNNRNATNLYSLSVTGYGNSFINNGSNHDTYLTIGSTGSLYVRTYDSATYSTKLTLDSSTMSYQGNLAVNKITADYALDVAGTAKANTMRISNTDYAYLYMTDETANKTHAVIADNTSIGLRVDGSYNNTIYVSDSGIGFRLNGSTIGYFNANTYFGLNITNPTERLHVNGNAKIEGTFNSVGIATINAGIKTDTITNRSGQQLVLNAGEAANKFGTQTSEYVYVNAEKGLAVYTPDRLTTPDNHSNFEGTYLTDTAVLRGDTLAMTSHYGGSQVQLVDASTTSNSTGRLFNSNGQLFIQQENASGSASSGGTIHITGYNATDLGNFNVRSSYTKVYGSLAVGKSTNPTAVLDVAGNIVVSGTVDGVDIAAFKTSFDTNTLTKKTDIPDAANLNTYTTDGYYHQTRNLYADNGTNYPTNQAGMLEVMSDDLMVYQRYTVFNDTHNQYIRTQYNGTWYSWALVYTDLNVSSSLNADTVDGYHLNQDVRTTASPSFAGLTVDTGSWSHTGLKLTGTAPSIYFDQDDTGSNAFIGVNGNNLYILDDMDQNGFYDGVPYPLTLNFTTQELALYGNNVVVEGSSPTLTALTADGNVGIGTTTPTAGYKLDVNGAAIVSGQFVVDTDTLYVRADTDRVGINTSTPNTAFHVVGDLTIGEAGGQMNVIRTNAAGQLQFLGNAIVNNNVIMTLDDDTNNVGINTATPSEALDVAGNIAVAGDIYMRASTTEDRRIEIGTGRTGNGHAYVDLIGDSTYTGYGLRLIRGNTGANAASEVAHRGTGSLTLNAVDAGILRFSTSNTERMRITSTGAVGIGTTAPSAKLDVVGNAYVQGNLHTSGTLRVDGNRIYFDGASDTTSDHLRYATQVGITYHENGNATWRLSGNGDNFINGGNVGIGTTTPTSGYKLDVNGAAIVSGQFVVDTDTLYVRADTDRVGINTSTPSEALDVVGNIAVSGNAKIGRPSDHWTNSDYYDVTSIGQLSTEGSYEVVLTSNGYRNNSGTWTSLAAGTFGGAAQIRMNPQGKIYFGTDSSKASGSSTSVSIRMALTDTGLGINTTTPSDALDVVGNIAVSGNIWLPATGTESRRIEVGTSRTGASYGHAYIDLVGDSTYGDYGLRIMRGNTGPNTYSVIGHKGTGSLIIRTEQAGNIQFDTTGSTRAVITADGKIGIGTTAPGAVLHVNGTTRITRSGEDAEILRFDTERPWSFYQRSSGSGTELDLRPSVDGKTFTVTTTSGANVATFRSNSTAPRFGVGTGSPQQTFHVYCTTGEAAHIQRTSDGTAIKFSSASGTVGYISVSGTTTSYNTSSDYRLKEAIEDVTGATDRVKLLNPVNFAWKDSGKRVDGFIAHELAAVVPEAVTGEKDAVDENGDPIYQGIDQSKLVPLLTAALKEAVARIEQLEQQIKG